MILRYRHFVSIVLFSSAACCFFIISQPILLLRLVSSFSVINNNNHIMMRKNYQRVVQRDPIILAPTITSHSIIYPISSLNLATSENESWETTHDEEDDDDDDDRSTTASDEESSDNDLLYSEYQRWTDAVEKAITALKKKQKSLQTELEKAKKVQEMESRANLLTTYLYMFTDGVTSATVQDWENDGQDIVLTLDTDNYDTASAEVDALYQQVRKLKRGSQVIQELLDETSNALNILLETQVDLQSAVDDDTISSVDSVDRLRLVQDRLIRTSRITQFNPPSENDNEKQKSSKNQKQQQLRNKKNPEIGTPASNIRKLHSDAGCTILVGRNRRGNEYISLSIARGDDIWMHARNTPGAHVLIMQRRGNKQATENCYQFAANLASFYSDSRMERKVIVTAAQPKHIQKPRGAPLGAVKLREEWKVFTGYPHDVPEELKDARAVSGLSDEYRATDKAKLRKLNKQQHIAKKKKQQAKRKAKLKAKQDNKQKAASE